jgi:hypothetical protein
MLREGKRQTSSGPLHLPVPLPLLYLFIFFQNRKAETETGKKMPSLNVTRLQ